ncbi:PTS transporter subunit EIIC [Arthrobacter woluwensis]|nr:PTS transporter subunit EIIC [Arthrobacter woluwensis]
MIVVLLLVPLVFIVVGPVSSVMSSGLSQGVSAIFTVAPWLGGALVGGLWQVLVIFGLHWTFIPLFMVEYQQSGFIYLLAPVFAAKLAQTAATAAVWWRTRDQSLRSLSAPATLSGLLAGVTEPALYGVNLPLRRPFIFGIIGGVLGGAVISAGGIASNSFALASLVSVPSLMGRGSVAMVFIGLGVAMAAAFVLTALFGVPRPRLVPPEDSVANDDGRVRVFSPLRGAIRPLADVDDPVFSRGALGPGLAVVPAEGIVRAPFAGTVVAAPVGSHALGLRAGNGAEVLIHIGLDTVKLAGEFFTRRVEVGNHVDPGQVILEFDREALLAAGYDLITPVVLTNSRRFDLFESVEGDAGHETVLFSVGRSGAPQGDSSSLPASATHLREGSA